MVYAMRLFHNANITDINSIAENGLLPANVTGNHNWDYKHRSSNSEDVVYLFSPIKKNVCINYGICLVEVEVDEAEENEMNVNDDNVGDYTEYVADGVKPERIVAIYIPQIFKEKISEYITLRKSALNKIVWCDMEADVYSGYIPNLNDKYGLGGKHIYSQADSETIEQFVKTVTTLDATEFNYFRGVKKSGEAFELYNVRYIKERL